MSHSVKVIKVCGILDDAQAKQFRQEILSFIAARANVERGESIEVLVDVLVDFEQTAFVDSSGLGALISALKAVKAAHGRLSLCSVRHEIKMLLELADVIQFFPIFSDQADFYQQEKAAQSTRV